MHRYNRNEPFRYTFEKPVPGMFQIVAVDDRVVETSLGEINIIDISPEGAKLQSKLRLPDKKVKIYTHFKLEEREFHFIGDVIWQKQSGNVYQYGVHFLLKEKAKHELIESLKQYVKNNSRKEAAYE